MGGIIESLNKLRTTVGIYGVIASVIGHHNILKIV